MGELQREGDETRELIRRHERQLDQKVEEFELLKRRDRACSLRYAQLEERCQALNQRLTAFGETSAGKRVPADQVRASENKSETALERSQDHAESTPSSTSAQSIAPSPWQDVVACGKVGPLGNVLVTVDARSLVFKLTEADLVESKAVTTGANGRCDSLHSAAQDVARDKISSAARPLK